MIIQALQSLRESKLVRRDGPLTTMWQVIGWWEARRLIFNIVVGACGIATCLTVLFMGVIGESVFGIPAGLPDPPIFALIAIVLYGIMANICYSGGWIVELLVRKAWPQESELFATLAFALGLVFAAFLTILPGVTFVPIAVMIFVGKMLGLGGTAS